ncbi:MAG TPA: tetratricopeptide repeat protein, partial [Pseudonocardiaceae bacterium]|nr:tetratricopeptide repeat protein [Pseudonocardiaceae bacterium]
MSAGARPSAEVPDGAQVNIAFGQARQYNVRDGDLHVHHGDPSYRVDKFRPHRPGVPLAVRRQPSRLLAARHQVVDFTGRERELAELAVWRDDPDLGLACRLVHGPGGQGKTRLAARFAQQSAELDWTVAYAVHRSYDAAPTAGLDAALVTGSPGLLLIVDYAERWPTGDLLALAQDPLLRTGVPTRVLLLSRPAGGWWDSLVYRLDRFDMATDQMALRALADTVAARTLVFTAARDRFAALLDVLEPDQISSPTRLGEDAFGLVLTVHMAALAAVDAHARGDTSPADPAALSAYLLNRERDHWQSMYDNDQRVRTPSPMMARTVFTATLTRPLPYSDGVSALRRVGIPSPEQVLDDHRLCYPPADPATVCEPLYPDRLGEDFLALHTPGHDLTSYQPDPWADTTVAHLLSGAEDLEGDQRLPGYTPQVVTVLIETARRWPHIGRRQLFPLLRERPDLALAAGGIALARLADLPDVDLGVLEALEALLPTGRHVDFDLAAAAIAARLTSHRLAATNDPADHARLNFALGYRLTNAGRREEALAATSKAVEVYRRLAGVNPGAFEPDLALALNNLGAMLSNLGRREEALEATSEAVEVYRRLAGVNPGAFEPDLALALNNLGIRLSNLGR